MEPPGRKTVKNAGKPDGVSGQELDSLHKSIKDYITYWNDTVTYYAIGKDRLDETAKSYFFNAMDKIRINKNILKSRGFKGEYSFFIQNAESGHKFAISDITF